MNDTHLDLFSGIGGFALAAQSRMGVIQYHTRTTARRDGRPIGLTQRQVSRGDRRQIWSGILFISVPRKGYIGCWSTENGRAVLLKTDKTNGSNWTLKVNGQEVGTGYPRLDEMVAANEWAIRKVL